MENTNQMSPEEIPRLEVFEKAATKKDDHNHPNSIRMYSIRNAKKKKMRTNTALDIISLIIAPGIIR